MKNWLRLAWQYFTLSCKSLPFVGVYVSASIFLVIIASVTLQNVKMLCEIRMGPIPDVAFLLDQPVSFKNAREFVSSQAEHSITLSGYLRKDCTVRSMQSSDGNWVRCAVLGLDINAPILTLCVEGREFDLPVISLNPDLGKIRLYIAPKLRSSAFVNAFGNVKQGTVRLGADTYAVHIIHDGNNFVINELPAENDKRNPIKNLVNRLKAKFGDIFPLRISGIQGEAISKVRGSIHGMDDWFRRGWEFPWLMRTLVPCWAVDTPLVMVSKSLSQILKVESCSKLKLKMNGSEIDVSKQMNSFYFPVEGNFPRGILLSNRHQLDKWLPGSKGKVNWIGVYSKEYNLDQLLREFNSFKFKNYKVLTKRDIAPGWDHYTSSLIQQLSWSWAMVVLTALALGVFVFKRYFQDMMELVGISRLHGRTLFTLIPLILVLVIGIIGLGISILLSPIFLHQVNVIMVDSFRLPPLPSYMGGWNTILPSLCLVNLEPLLIYWFMLRKSLTT